MELRLLRGAPAAFAGNQLVASAGERPDDDRLNDPALGDRLGELFERGLVELPPRLLGMRLDRGDRKAGEPLAASHRPVRLAATVVGPRDVPFGGNQRLLAPRFPEQRPEAPSQAALGRSARLAPIVGAHAATLSFGSRPINSRA